MTDKETDTLPPVLSDEEQGLISQDYPGYWVIEYPRAVAQAQLKVAVKFYRDYISPEEHERKVEEARTDLAEWGDGECEGHDISEYSGITYPLKKRNCDKCWQALKR